MKEVKVVAVIATYRRPTELARLLASLEKSTVPFHAVVVTDNAGDAATGQVMEKCEIPYRLVLPGSNLGCGGGLRAAEAEALRQYPDLTHVCVLDDDVVVERATIAGLLETMAAQGAGSACPLAHDAAGKLGWHPGLTRGRAFKVLRRAATPAEYLEKCGTEPEPFNWATGVMLLVSRGTLDKAGLHRDDFWMRGEDLDFALRITAVAKGVLVPTLTVAHLPPGGGKVVNNFPERMKNSAMLQNCAYLAARTSHGLSLARNWPGNVRWHIRRFGLRALGDVIRATWLGAVCGRPAGVAKGGYFRKRLAVGK